MTSSACIFWKAKLLRVFWQASAPRLRSLLAELRGNRDRCAYSGSSRGCLSKCWTGRSSPHNGCVAATKTRRATTFWSLLAWFLLQPGLAFASGMTFSGALERVGNGSLSIRLADRRVIDAALPNRSGLDSGAVAAQYRVGDQLEIACQPIQPVWEQETARHQYLEVTAIRLIRRPSPEELSTLFGGVPFREGENLLQRPEASLPMPSQGPDANDPGGQELARARKVNLEFAGNMPNFVADETASTAGHLGISMLRI